MKVGFSKFCRVVWQLELSLFLGCCCLLTTTLVQSHRQQQELCNTAQNKCISRVGCGMALHNYHLGCGDLIYGQTEQCTSRCQRALISLLSTEYGEGEAFMHCDCEGSEYCQNQKARVEVCSKDVMVAMKSVYDENTDISCSLAEMICRADTSCYTAIEYYKRHCTKLFRNEKCTSRCNNSLAILHRQEKAKKLRTCVCEGSEDYPCQSIQDWTQRLCFGRDPAHVRKHRHKGHHNHTRTSTSGYDIGAVPTKLNDYDYDYVGEDTPTPEQNSRSAFSLASSAQIKHLPLWTFVTLLLLFSFIT